MSSKRSAPLNDKLTSIERENNFFLLTPSLWDLNFDDRIQNKIYGNNLLGLKETIPTTYWPVDVWNWEEISVLEYDNKCFEWGKGFMPNAGIAEAPHFPKLQGATANISYRLTDETSVSFEQHFLPYPERPLFSPGNASKAQ